jgi:RHS repeat-associated protein
MDQGMTRNALPLCGEYFDNETGNIYLRVRYYNPANGRMITEDTYRGKPTDPLSMNLYSYANNNPVLYVDLSGNVVSGSEIPRMTTIFVK